MAIIQKDWSATQTILQTSGYGGATATITTMTYSSVINLQASGFEGAEIVVTATPTGNTDEITVHVFSALDGVYSNVASVNVPLTSQNISNESGKERRLPIVLVNTNNMRIGLVRDGSTDSYHAQIDYKAWRYQTV